MLVCCAEPFPLWKSTLPRQKSSLLNSTHPSQKSSLLNWTSTTPSPSPISTSAANLFQLVVGGIFQRWSPMCAYLHFQKSSLFSLPLLWRERREDGDFIFLERLICFFSYSVSRQHYCVRRSIMTALQSALDPCFFGAFNMFYNSAAAWITQTRTLAECNPYKGEL